MSNELLEVTINGDLSVADNVEAVCHDGAGEGRIE